MKAIKLTRGKATIVDDADYTWLSQWKWHCTSTGYAARREYLGDGNRRWVRMHRLILNAPESMEVDHINGDSLDNQRKNLRLATHSQNMKNITPYAKEKTSKHKGVSLSKQRYITKSGEEQIYLRWRAYIVLNDKQINLGRFDTEEEAARAYDEAAKVLHGEHARLNFPDT